MALFDGLIQSKEIKKLLVNRSFEYKIPLKYVCDEVGVNYSAFMEGYINSVNSDFFEIKEEKFIEVLNFLGINIRMAVIVDTSKDMKKLSYDLSQKYESKEEELRRL